jgi:hypothetical protein
MPPYPQFFFEGDLVQVVGLKELEAFRANWKYHHPLAEHQLAFAGRRATVASVGFYHGGDVIYELAGVPGIWHEACLHALPAGSV